MKRMMMLMSVALTSAVASIASAQEAAVSAAAVPPSGLQLGLRLGYALPMGDAAKDASLSDAFSGGVPIIIDAGYRVNPNIYVGAYGQYGFLFINSDKNAECNQSGTSCSGSDVRLGANLHYHISPDQNFDPWVGLGLGYEWATMSVSAGGIDGSATYKGFEFADLQVGGDYHVSPQLGIGPFISFSLGQYSSYSASAPGVSMSGDIPSKAMHEWLTIGVRGVYNL